MPMRGSVAEGGGLVTCMSRVAGRLQIQLGRRTSAGWEREPGTRRVSFEGARAADLAAVKTTSLMELCREM